MVQQYPHDRYSPDPQCYWQKWQQDSHAKYSIFSKDFIQEKILRLNITSYKSQQQSYFNYQQNINQKDSKIDIINQHVKLWFNFTSNDKIIAKIQPNLYQWYYYRNGMQFNSQLYNFYGGLQHDQYLSQKIYKIGLDTLKSDAKSSCRLQYKHEESNLILEQKLEIKDQKWRYMSYLSYDIMNRLLKGFQCQIGHIDQSNAFYLRNRSKKESSLTLKNLLNEIIVDYVHENSDSNRFGVEGVYNWEKRNFIFGGVWQHKFNQKQGRSDECLKIKGDFQRNIYFSIKKRIGDIGNYIYGLKISDFGRTNKLIYGLALNFNF